MTSTTLQRRILKYVNNQGQTKAIPITVNQFMERGTPDVLIVCFGFTIWIECKNPQEEPTPIQRKRLREWTGAGAHAWVIHDTQEDYERFIRQFDAIYDQLLEAFNRGVRDAFNST